MLQSIAEDRTCVICGFEMREIGHNPNPIKDHGKCCTACNLAVIQMRMHMLN